MIWTVAIFETTCGGCGRLILVDQPMALVTQKRLQRCRECAGPVDERAVAASREQCDLDRARESETPATIANMRPTYRPRPTAAPTGFSKIADFADRTFDPKAAAAGEDR